MPIQSCPAHFGGGRTRNHRSVGHGPGRPSRWPAFGCATASGAPMPIRTPWTWMGETPLSAMPQSAPRRMGPDSPILPAATGSLPSNSPVREGHVEPGRGASRPCAAMWERSTACRSTNGVSAAAKRRSNRFPAKGSLVWERPEGRGPEVRKRARPRTRSSPSDCGVAPSPARTSAAARSAQDRKAQDTRVLCLTPPRRCARRELRGAHWHPLSFSQSGAAPSRAPQAAHRDRGWRMNQLCAASMISAT